VLSLCNSILASLNLVYIDCIGTETAFVKKFYCFGEEVERQAFFQSAANRFFDYMEESIEGKFP
jgi:hypothetical protein